MPPKLRQLLRRKAAAAASAAAAAETATEIANVEETLRRLGLVGGGESPGWCPPQPKDSEEYLASIRKAKEEAARVLRERECRQYAVEQQKRENEVMLTNTDKEKALLHVIEEARFILEEEKRNAMESVAKRMGKAEACVMRASELGAAMAVRKREIALMENTDNTTDECLKEEGCLTDVKERRRELKAEAIREHCRVIVTGVVELAIRVYDNMYTPVMYNGIPLRRFPQDLGVTRWRTWVEELVFSRLGSKPLSDLLATTSLRELRVTGYKAVEDLVGTASSGNDASRSFELEFKEADAGADETEAFNADTVDAQAAVNKVTELQCKYRSRIIAASVREATHLIRCEEERELQAQLDDIRRLHEADAADEAVPGWMHKLPPAGCFLFGDELSGLKQIAEAICSDVLMETTVVTGRPRVSTSQLADVSRCTVDWETSGSDSVAHRVIAASQLLRANQGHTGPGGAGFGAPVSAKAYKGSGAAGANAARLKDTRQAEDFVESKQYIDALCEALVKELVAVYHHNIMLVLRPAVDTSEATTDPPPVMRLLFLVGFPDTDMFLRTLHQRLHLALEALEYDVSRMLREEECGDECGSTTLFGGKQSPRQPLSTTMSSSRKKGSRICVTPPTRKGCASRSSVLEGEEPLLVRPRVYPPLCLVGVFLQYDIPSRYRRMRRVRGRSTQPTTDASSQAPSPSISQPFSGSVPLTHSEEEKFDSFAEWPVRRLRSELIQQDRKMRQSWKTWCTRVSKGSSPHIADVERPQHAEKVRRRGRASVVHTRSNENVIPNASQTPIPPGVVVPRVLFFERRENLPDNTEHGDLVLYLILNLKSELKRIANSISGGSLVPGQLSPPLKLCDYRLPATVLAQLVDVHDRFQVRWNDLMLLTPQAWHNSILSASASQSPGRCSVNDTQSGETTLTWGNAVALEVEVYRAFHLISSDLLDFLTYEVFPPSLWGGKAEPCHAGSLTNASSGDRLSRTLHFMTLDDNYSISREALFQLMSEGLGKLGTSCAMLLGEVIEVALADVGEALSRLCAWAHAHMMFVPRPSQDVGNTSPNSGSPTFSPLRSQSPPCPSAHESVKRAFLSNAPRIEFDELLHAVQQLDGERESLENFQYFMWAYSSRVHETALSCLLDSVDAVSKKLGVEVSPSWDATAPRVVRRLLSELFAVPPLERTNELEDDESDERLDDTVRTLSPSDGTGMATLSQQSPPTISVSLGRLVAAVVSMRRCCMVSAVCAARWVDAMYAAALKIPPSGKFPSSCRPSDVAAIFTPPVASQEEIASQSSLAVQLMEQLVPVFSADSVRSRNCWDETGVELILQNFSMYQKSVLNEEEFIHCVLQAQLNCAWRLLPERLQSIAKTLSFAPPFEVKDPVTQSVRIAGVLDSLFKWMRLRHCKPAAESSLLMESDCGRIFRSAVRCQKHVLFQGEHLPKSKRRTLSSTAAQSSIGSRLYKKPVLHLQQFLVDLLFRRPFFSESSSGDCMKDCCAVREPSTKELREMVQSFPPELREQGPDQLEDTEPLPMEAWQRIKWWHFFPNDSKTAWTDFLKCYLYRVLTVSFDLRNGVLCSRPVPRLPDLLCAVVRTRGALATVERYYHALVALNASRIKKLRHSQLAETPLMAEVGHDGTETLASLKGSLLDLCPLSVFDLTLSVKEALYFLRPSLDHPAPSATASVGRSAVSTLSSRALCTGKSSCGEGQGKFIEEEESEGDCTISLEEDLILLLEIEGSSSLSLPLLGASHWGRYLLPRLTVL